MKHASVLGTFFVILIVGGLSAGGANADEAAPICERVSVAFRSDDSGKVGASRLKNAQDFMLERLADHGYAAKYVSFYAPGEPLPANREAEIQADAAGGDRILIEIEYSDEIIQRSLGLRIYKIGAKPPYHSFPVYNGNATVGPVSIGARIKAKFRQLLKAKEMISCSELAAKAM